MQHAHQATPDVHIPMYKIIVHWIYAAIQQYMCSHLAAPDVNIPMYTIIVHEIYAAIQQYMCSHLKCTVIHIKHDVNIVWSREACCCAVSQCITQTCGWCSQSGLITLCNTGTYQRRQLFYLQSHSGLSIHINMAATGLSTYCIPPLNIYYPHLVVFFLFLSTRTSLVLISVLIIFGMKTQT